MCIISDSLQFILTYYCEVGIFGNFKSSLVAYCTLVQPCIPHIGGLDIQLRLITRCCHFVQAVVVCGVGKLTTLG